MKSKQMTGFTLIELLVVIAIIGVLATVVLIALGSARSKARDARRRADIKQISTAMELYYAQFGTYNVTGTGYAGTGSGWFGSEGGAYTLSVAHGLVNAGFLGSATVDDPDANKRPGYMIYLCGGDTTYSISATLENPTADDITHVQAACNGVGPNGIYTTYGKNLSYP